jgi:hypothetical protein
MDTLTARSGFRSPKLTGRDKVMPAMKFTRGMDATSKSLFGGATHGKSPYGH